MTLPNQLTLLRLALTVVFVVCLTVGVPYGQTAAFVIFVVAALTDYLDGVLARRLGQITDFGKLMDPLADKVLTASAFICLIPLGAFPAWVVIIIIAREFLITGLRLVAGAKGVLLPAERLGKHKTAWQMITILFYLALFGAGDWPALFSEPLQELGKNLVGPILIGITILLTVYSGAAYLWKNRRLIDFR
jgi:CDP-diacylglycerol--glycerol-3-phosphate 3-phosphatidyltransferase